MARKEKANVQALYDHAFSHVPTTGEIEYSVLRENIRQSDLPEAVVMLPELKKRGAVTSRIEVNNHVVTHMYSRKGGG